MLNELRDEIYSDAVAHARQASTRRCASTPRTNTKYLSW